MKRLSKRTSPSVYRNRPGRHRLSSNFNRPSRLRLAERLEQRAMLSIDSGAISAWTNPADRLDVDADGTIAPMDALLVINDLNRYGSRELGTPATPPSESDLSTEAVTGSYIDVDGDGSMSPRDALMVINALNTEAIADMARIRLETTDLQGNAISTIDAGQSFLLRAQVEDLRDGASGIFAAYLDVLYDSSLVSINGDITFGTSYGNVAEFDITTAGIIDEIGSLQDPLFDPLGPGEFLFFTVPMVATADGSAVFTADPADDSPAHDVLFFDPPDAVNLDDILFEGTTLQIGDGGGGDLPTLSIGDVTVNEGDSGTTDATFTVTLSQASSQTVTVNFATADGLANVGSDYQATSGTVSFDAGVTSRTITVPVLGDNRDELNETFRVNLSQPSGATVADGQGEATILDDDDPPVMSIGDVTVVEGNAGTRTASFTVSLSAASGLPVQANFATANGTASVGLDFEGASGTVNFTPGQTTQTINVTILSDTTIEPDETFTVTLTSPTNATLGDAVATGTITDDDQAGQQDLVRVRLVTTDTNGNPISSIAQGQSFLVQAFVEDLRSQAQGVFAAYLDMMYSSTLVGVNGSITFSPTYPNGQSGSTSVVGIVDEAGAFDGQNPLGPGEQLLLSVPFIANATGTASFTANPADLQGNDVLLFGVNNAISTEDIQFVGTSLQIGGGTTLPGISISDAQVQEGNSGVTAAVFNVSLSQAVSQTVTVNYATANGTALAGNDYQATSGSVTFAPGETSKTISVNVFGDTNVEPDETFLVNLSNPSGGVTTDGQGVGTIINDDQVTGPAFAIMDVTQAEGNAGATTPFTFTVTLSQALSSTATVNFATQNGTATAGSDYQATSGTLTFAPGVTSQTVVVNVTGDDVVEQDETFQVVLSSPSGAAISDPQATGTITNDDQVAGPALSISNVSQMEGGQGTTSAFAFTVTLSEASSGTVTVNFATQDGTATAGSDYQAASGTLTFNPGETSKTVVVNVFGDNVVEQDETFQVVLSNASGANISTGNATGTIINDDQGGGGGSSIAGFVYADVNNNGHKDAPETGIPDVTVTLSGQDLSGNPVQQTTLTGADGSFSFNNLPMGTYSVTETHPAFFVDGIDRIEGDSSGTAGNDVFTDISLGANESLAGYHFGERGLRAEFISMKLFTANVMSMQFNDFSFATGNGWMSFDDGISGSMTAIATAPSGSVRLTFYDQHMNILGSKMEHDGSVSMDLPDSNGQVRFLRVTGTHPDIQVNFTGGQNSAIAPPPEAADEALAGDEDWLLP